MVERVLRISADFELNLLPHVERLPERGVHHIESRSRDEPVPGCIAKRPCSWNCISERVVPRIDIAVVAINLRVTDYVWIPCPRNGARVVCAANRRRKWVARF